MIINIPGIIRNNVEIMELLLEIKSPFTSKHPKLSSGKLTKLSNSGIITKLGYKNSVVQYTVSDYQKSVIRGVLDKL